MSQADTDYLALCQRIHKSTRCLDDGHLEDFIALFVEDSEYRVLCKAPELDQDMIWMQCNRQELQERLEVMSHHEWMIASMQQNRIVSVDCVKVDDEQAVCSSTFSLYNTDQQGGTELFLVGRYDDLWVFRENNWMLQQRDVRLTTRLMTQLTPIPV